MITELIKLLNRIIETGEKLVARRQSKRISELEAENKRLLELIAYREAVAREREKAAEANRIRAAAERGINDDLQ